MRIIRGNLKNKKLNFPINLKTRPLKDRVRQNIFNIIEHSNNYEIHLKNSLVLDLYAGSGSFGLECISRGARKVLFVENDKEALKSLRKNIASLNVEKYVEVFPENVSKFFKKFSLKNYFDIIFFDPPYKNTNFSNIFDTLKEIRVLKEKHIIILHRERNSSLFSLDNYNILKKKIYGRSEIFFLSLIRP